jgi:signal transduction histidine kinase
MRALLQLKGPRWMSSLTGRLSVSLSLIVIGAVAIILGVLSVQMAVEQDTLRDRSLEWQAKDVAVHLRREAGEVRLALPSELEKAYSAPDGQYLFLISDAEGAPLMHSNYGMRLAGHLPEDWFDPGAGRERVSYFEFRDLERGQTFYGASMRVWLGEQPYTVQVAQGPVHSDVLADTVIEEFFERQWWAFLLFLVAIIATVVLTVRLSLRSIGAVSRVARSLGPASLDARLETEGIPSEVLPIVEAVNEALRKIEDGYRRQREFTANAAHQLRTPLTILRADLENRELDRAEALGEVRALERLVQQFLHLAQADNFQLALHEQTDLHEVAEETVAALAPFALKRGQEVALEAPEGALFVRGNRSFIAVALRNLIENALQYSPAGEAVTVRVERPGKISVIARGCGIEKSRLGLVFDRFWRADRKVEDGAGLGLSIVQQIMAAHGGRAEAAQNPGGGALFTLIFPEFSADPSTHETAPSAP